MSFKMFITNISLGFCSMIHRAHEQYFFRALNSPILNVEFYVEQKNATNTNKLNWKKKQKKKEKNRTESWKKYEWELIYHVAPRNHVNEYRICKKWYFTSVNFPEYKNSVAHTKHFLFEWWIWIFSISFSVRFSTTFCEFLFFFFFFSKGHSKGMYFVWICRSACFSLFKLL